MNNNSGVQTILLVAILLILVGFGAWWFTKNKNVQPADNNLIEITVPSENNQETR